MRSLFLALVVVPSPLLQAQRRAMPPSEIVHAGRLEQIGDSLAPAAGKSVPLGRGPNYNYVLWHRESSSAELERHDAWSDIVVVKSGSATMLSGGTMDGAKETSPGEWRGGTSRAATRQTIGAGDIVTTPAGTPHQMLLGPGERITYVTIKVAAPAGASTTSARRR